MSLLASLDHRLLGLEPGFKTGNRTESWEEGTLKISYGSRAPALKFRESKELWKALSKIETASAVTASAACEEASQKKLAALAAE